MVPNWLIRWFLKLKTICRWDPLFTHMCFVSGKYTVICVYAYSCLCVFAYVVSDSRT